MLVHWMAVAAAGELETWVGGGASGGIVASTESDFASADGLTTQVELDGMVGWGWGHARVDWDFHVDPNTLGDEGADFFAYPSAVSDTGQFPMPEWAMVQFGREKHARVGLLNPNLGVEDWDPWINYAPTYSNNFIYVGAGRFLGADIGLSTASGYDVFAFGGYDVDWASYGGGVGVATLQDAWSTWSGIVVYPEFNGGLCPGGEDESCLNVFAQLAVEFYPVDPLWIAVEAYPGVKDDAFYTSTQLVANVLPEAVVNPFVRGELLFDPDEVTGAPGSSVSIGARSDTPEFLRLMIEGKATFLEDVTDLGVAVTIAVHRPEPNAYSFTDPFGTAEE